MRVRCMSGALIGGKWGETIRTRRAGRVGIGSFIVRTGTLRRKGTWMRTDFLKFTERLGIEGIGFKSLIPKLYFPAFLKESLGYRTHAMVSLPVLNPRTILNNGFDTYRLMDRHNDMRAMIQEMRFPEYSPFLAI